MSNSTIPLFFEEFGSGLPVILLHGFPLNHTIWNLIGEILAGISRVILPDLRGHGRSPVTDDGYGMENQARDVIRLMDDLKVEKAVLAGHSMGGYVCLALQRLFPERIIALALVASRAAADTAVQRIKRKETAEQILLEGTEDYSLQMAARLSARPKIQDTVRSMIRSTSPRAIAGALRGMAERSDSQVFLPDIRIPALVLAGETDAIIPLDESRSMADAFPDCPFISAQGCGHMLMMENPRLVGKALLSLIARVK